MNKINLDQILQEDLKAAFGDEAPKSPVAGARRHEEFNIVYIFRMASYYRAGLLGLYYRGRLRRLRVMHALTLTAGTCIGPGFRVGHLGPIVIHFKATLGADVTVCQGVTIGKIHEGSKAGVPQIGNHVYLAPNSVVLGRVKIGDHVVIAPNSFVNFDVPDHSIVIGNPGQIHKKQFPTSGMSSFTRKIT